MEWWPTTACRPRPRLHAGRADHHPAVIEEGDTLRSGCGETRDPALARRTSTDRTRVLAGRSLRAFADGYVAILLPVHLSRLGFEAFAVGAISTATLLGSALLTLALGMMRASGHAGGRRCSQPPS